MVSIFTRASSGIATPPADGSAGWFSIIRLFRGGASMLRVSLVGIVLGTAAFAATGSSSVTFYKDVLPVLQKQCQTCHRAGEVAPMPFVTYKETRPWAKAIKTAVLTKKMPPWFADTKVGHFSNESVLSEAEIATLVNWADNGAPEGHEKDKPAPPVFAEGWEIGKPDI